MTQGETTALWPPSRPVSPHRLIWVLKVIYSNIRGEASKVHLADKDAIADRYVVPGARLQLCILFLSRTQFLSLPPPLSPCRLSVLLCPSKRCSLSCLFSIFPPPTPSLPRSLTTPLSSYLSSLPPTHLHPCFPLADSYSTPSFLRHPDFMAISRSPFIMSPLRNVFLKYANFV